MKVCSHKGLVIAILTRNEHCPPHVHVGTAQWDARFLFCFWHNDVRLWDVTPARNEPNVAVLEELSQALKQPVHLRRARECWWSSRQTLCLENQQWDAAAEDGQPQGSAAGCVGDPVSPLRRTGLQDGVAMGRAIQPLGD